MRKNTSDKQQMTAEKGLCMCSGCRAEMIRQADHCTHHVCNQTVDDLGHKHNWHDCTADGGAQACRKETRCAIKVLDTLEKIARANSL